MGVKKTRTSVNLVGAGTAVAAASGVSRRMKKGAAKAMKRGLGKHAIGKIKGRNRGRK
mgnify:CR=1 FL=1